MNILKQLGVVAVMATIAVPVSFAADVIYKFETEFPLSNSVYDIIPGLNLNEVNSSSFHIVTDPVNGPYPVKEIKNFNLDFEHAPDLTVNSLKRVEDGHISCPNSQSGDVFFGSVNNAWLFRTVEVTLCTSYTQGMAFADFSYMITVKDMESYTYGDVQPGMIQLADGQGFAFDTTPNKVADTLRTNFDGKVLRLSLLQRQAEVEIPNMGVHHGFVVNASWLGHGDKPLVLEQYPANIWDTAIALVYELISGSEPELNLQMLSIRYIDAMGNEQQTSPMELRYILEQSYGSLPPPL